MASVLALPRASLIATLSVVSGLAGAIGGAACGTDAVGIDACCEIEAARCRRAVECGLPLDYPRPAGDPTAACERFYLDACLHGIQSGVEPTLPQRKSCVDAVSTSSCDVVREPQRAPGCAFIIPSAEGAAPEPTSTTAPPPPIAQPDSGKK